MMLALSVSSWRTPASLCMEKKIGIAKFTDLNLCTYAYLSVITIRTVLWSNREAGIEPAKHVAALPISHFCGDWDRQALFIHFQIR